MVPAKSLQFFNLIVGACAVQWQEDIAYMFDVSLWHSTEYEYIIEVSEGELPHIAGQDLVHSMLKCSKCVAASEWHMCEAIETMV